MIKRMQKRFVIHKIFTLRKILFCLFELLELICSLSFYSLKTI